ncbi:hypothetical protein RCH22_000453 [Cryobacterium psychrotolerans]|nr:hypothetical protein [Cryobacterium psychrotolerans]
MTFADSAAVALFSYDLRGTVTAESDCASQLLARRNVSVDSNLASSSRDEFVTGMQAYGQRVCDAGGLVVDFIVVSLEHASKMPSELAAFAAFAALADGVVDEMRALKMQLDDLGNTRVRPLRDGLDNIVHAECLVQKIAARFSLDYGDFARLAVTSRANGTIETEAQRKQILLAVFNPSGGTQVE